MGARRRESHLEVSFLLFLKIRCSNIDKKFIISCTEKNGKLNFSNSCTTLVRKFDHVTIPGADWTTASYMLTLITPIVKEGLIAATV